ncbi:hypothetical protein CUU45_10160 [Pectobacterium polaris]|uniref:VENN motif pre-toxin domain-containing protein n=1 Tax=Pectobacterium polaris TaxID=2042057 RepID=A0AAW4NUK8_9GAMM|nr:VENN motif pre-toxin domain-containing protein [Pectobacterium polaris]MCL6359257.1 hypothetical protein [Pectobacterium polaris]MCU1797630.1 hypothetical protein [Pectobacterium polaris]
MTTKSTVRKTANDLTEEEKQSVSALSTLASGLLSGLASNSLRKSDGCY